MARGRIALAIAAASALSALMTACGGSNGTVTTSQQKFTLTIDSSNPASGVQVGMTVNGSTATQTETTPATVTGKAGTSYALTAPLTAGSDPFTSWTGCTGSGTSSNICEVTLDSNTTVTANYSTTAIAPTVVVTAPATMVSGAGFSVTVTVTGSAGTPTGTVALGSSGLTYPTQTLTNGSVSVSVPAGTWDAPAGNYTLTAAYTPDANSSSIYTSATGTAPVAITAAPTYGLTIDSTNPASGVVVSITPSGETISTNATTPTSVNLAAGSYVLSAPTTAGGNAFSSWTGCTSTTGTGTDICNVTLNANTTVTANYGTSSTLVAPTVTVTPGSSSVTTEQSLNVTVTVAAPSGSGDAVPTGSVVLSNGSGYTSAATALSVGSSSSTAGITIPKQSLTLGLNTLTATYTPDTGSSTVYTTATGTHPVTETAITPTVTVTPGSNAIDSEQSLSVTVAVAAPGGDPTPTGSVTLTSGSYTSGAQTLTSGSVTISIAAGDLPLGSDTLTATYTPDSTSANIYGTATGTSGTVTVGAATTVSVDESSVGPATTNKILGVNLESWYDVVANANSGVLSGLQNAGMQSLRWPGGSWSDQYHWNNGGTPYMCACSSATSCTPASSGTDWGGNADEAFGSFETNIAKAGSGFDLALTADYGTNETCTGGGDPAEAAAWAAAAVTDGYPASHITVGNEEYGSWETDLHANPHDPTTYADAVTGTSGYYDSIKTAITNAGGVAADTLVGVVVDADGSSTGWDHTVLGDAAGSYDFVEYHYYPQYQGEDASDSSLLSTYVQNFTTNINTLKNELSTADEPTTPIYVGEISSNSGNGGTQNWSITQALYAGQILGEAMNDGVSRLTWWDGYGNCEGVGSAADGNLLPPNNSNLYGWQDWGAQNIFSAGASTDGSAGCTNDGNAGTLSPTAMAFQMFSQVAVNGENSLTATVTGDTTDVRAYAATHSGGTALVLFNLNPTTAEAVNISLSGETSTPGLTVLTYDKEMYDYTNVNCQADSASTFTPYPCTYDPTHDYSTVDWVQQPSTTDLGSQQLPYTLVLQPWSMNVVIIK